MSIVGSLPSLYKKTSTGAIEQWRIWVETSPTINNPNTGESTYDLVTEYGHVGGKLQQARENVAKGKNLGKKNATTAQEQALAQAKSEWEMKLSRKGYVEDIEKAKAGENAGAGGIRPMLAKAFEDCEKKFTFPCYGQTKLDGMRCIAVVNEDGSVGLWTREQKPIVSVPVIANAVANLGLAPGTVLDGELYNHDLKDDFEQLISIFRKQYVASAEEEAKAQYHIYDMPRDPANPGAGFGDRTVKLGLVMAKARPMLKLVETKLINNREELLAYRKDCQVRGYEGAMARSATSPYEEGKRSANLLKLKEFLEEDFRILGVEEGKGKMAGCAIFICTTAHGNTVQPDFNFKVKMEGELDGLKKYLTDASTWQGKKLSVKFFSYTNKNKVPRFPVGKAVRDYE